MIQRRFVCFVSLIGFHSNDNAFKSIALAKVFTFALDVAIEIPMENSKCNRERLKYTPLPRDKTHERTKQHANTTFVQ